MTLLDLLEKKRSLFLKIEEIASIQEYLIRDGKIEEFLDATSQRESLMSEITVNSRKHGKAEMRAYADGSDRVEILAGEIAGIIRSIQETDQRIERQIMGIKEELFEEVKSCQRANQAVKGYGLRHQRRARFIDTKG